MSGRLWGGWTLARRSSSSPGMEARLRGAAEREGVDADEIFSALGGLRDITPSAAVDAWREEQ